MDEGVCASTETNREENISRTECSNHDKNKHKDHSIEYNGNIDYNDECSNLKFDSESDTKSENSEDTDGSDEQSTEESVEKEWYLAHEAKYWMDKFVRGKYGRRKGESTDDYLNSLPSKLPNRQQHHLANNAFEKEIISKMNGPDFKFIQDNQHYNSEEKEAYIRMRCMIVNDRSLSGHKYCRNPNIGLTLSNNIVLCEQLHTPLFISGVADDTSNSNCIRSASLVDLNLMGEPGYIFNLFEVDDLEYLRGIYNLAKNDIFLVYFLYTAITYCLDSGNDVNKCFRRRFRPFTEPLAQPPANKRFRSMPLHGSVSPEKDLNSKNGWDVISEGRGMVLRRKVIMADGVCVVDTKIYQGIDEATQYMVLEEFKPIQKIVTKTTPSDRDDESSNRNYAQCGYLDRLCKQEIKVCLSSAKHIPILGMHHEWMEIFVYRNGKVVGNLHKEYKQNKTHSLRWTHRRSEQWK